MSMKEGCGLAVSIVLIIFVSISLATVSTWLLWNWLMPVIFGLPKITLAQSCGLVVLAHIVFPNNAIRKN